MERPGYFVLGEPIPSSEFQELLGRVTVDYTAPTDISAPTSVKHLAIKHSLQPVESEDLDVLLKSSSNVSGLGRLQATLELAADRGWNQNLHVQTSKVRTYRLKDHDKVFEDIVNDKDALSRVKKLFDYVQGGIIGTRKQVYMIVGFKTIVDSSITFERLKDQSKKASAKLPISYAADAVAPGSHILAGSLDPEIELSSQQSESTTQSHKSSKEQVFAVEYRPITKPYLLKKSGDWKPQLGLQKKKFDWGTAVMGDDESDDDDGLPSLKTEDIEQDAKVSAVETGSTVFIFGDKTR